MMKSKKIFAGIVLVLLLIGAFMAGGFVGFNNGYAYCVFHSSVADSYFTVRTLEQLKKGEINGAEKQLESTLDMQIMEHWGGLINKPLNFTMFSHDEEAISKIMFKVAAYRKSNPRKEDNAQVQEAIETVVNRYNK